MLYVFDNIDLHIHNLHSMVICNSDNQGIHQNHDFVVDGLFSSDYHFGEMKSACYLRMLSIVSVNHHVCICFFDFSTTTALTNIHMYIFIFDFIQMRS